MASSSVGPAMYRLEKRPTMGLGTRGRVLTISWSSTDMGGGAILRRTWRIPAPQALQVVAQVDGEERGSAEPAGGHKACGGLPGLHEADTLETAEEGEEGDRRADQDLVRGLDLHRAPSRRRSHPASLRTRSTSGRSA